MRIAKREKLASKRQMGCPKQLKYPLDTKKRVKNAMQRYRQRGTTKCKEFWGNWCRRAKRVGFAGTPMFKMKCTPKGKARRR